MEDEILKDAKEPTREESHSQRELEKRIFHLKTLYDLSQEIGFLREPHEIAKNLLLMMIGNFGVLCGFILLFDMGRGKVEAFTQRGLVKDFLDILSRKIESGDWMWLNEITEIQILKERNTPQTKGRENLFDLLTSLNLRLWIPFNIEVNFKGVIGLGEKLTGDPYTSDDQELLRTMANQGAVAIENAKLHQARIEALEHSKRELEQFNRAKSKALDHLSHELRTPIALVQGNIRLIKRKIQIQSPPPIRNEVFESLGRNLDRLSGIQQETDKIIRSYQELETRQRQVESDFAQPSPLERIDLYPFTERIIENVRIQAKHRHLYFYLDGQMDLHLLTNSKILEESLVGLLKNAIENTPDEGMVQVVLEKKDQWIQLKVMDFGIGISKENQRQLFDGLFHTLDTELYTSKKPYDFGAGGKGLDLLRMKVDGQRFGFDISVGSQRCPHLPTERDLCPGKISQCPHCRTREDCLNSGGSTFCLSFQVSEKTPS